MPNVPVKKCRVFVHKKKGKVAAAKRAKTHMKAKAKAKARMKSKVKSKHPLGASKVGPRSHKVQRLKKRHGRACGTQKKKAGP